MDFLIFIHHGYLPFPTGNLHRNDFRLEPARLLCRLCTFIGFHRVCILCPAVYPACFGKKFGCRPLVLFLLHVPQHILHHVYLPLPTGNLHLNDFRLEPARLLCRLCTFIGFHRVGILCPAVYTACFGTKFGCRPHVIIVVHVPQPILHQAVCHLPVAQPVTGPGFIQVIRYVAHAFHTTGHHDVFCTRCNTLSRQHDCLCAGCTHLIDRGGWDIGESRKFRGLRSRCLAQIGRQYVAEQYLLHIIGRQIGPIDGFLDGYTTQLGGGQGG